MIVIIASIFVPVVVGGLKKVTNMPCPHAEIRYNGELPRTAVWECYTPEFTTKKHRECWPAGHASGGFALLGLFIKDWRIKMFKNIMIGLLAISSLASAGNGVASEMSHVTGGLLITMLIAFDL